MNEIFTGFIALAIVALLFFVIGFMVSAVLYIIKFNFLYKEHKYELLCNLRHEKFFTSKNFFQGFGVFMFFVICFLIGLFFKLVLRVI